MSPKSAKVSFTEALVVVHVEPRTNNSFGLQKVVLLSVDNALAFTLYHHTMEKGPEDYEKGQVMVVGTPELRVSVPVSIEDRAIAVQTALYKIGYVCVSWLIPPEQDVFEAFKRAFPEAFETDAEQTIAHSDNASKAMTAPASDIVPKPKPKDGFDFSRN